MLRWFSFLCLMLVLRYGYAGQRAVTDTLLVNKGYLFLRGDTFTCARNAVIIVRDFAHLEIDQCSFGSGKGWQGIVVETGGSLTLKNSTLSDARFGVQIIGEAGRVIITNNKFERNGVAVQLYMPRWCFSQGVLIEGNAITVNPQGLPGKGISIQSIAAVQVPRGKELRVSGNQIRLQNGTTGIDLNGLSGDVSNGYNTRINQNRIWCESKVNRCGLLVQRSEGVEVCENTVSASSYETTGPFYPHGFVLKATGKGITLKHNRAYYMGIGYAFSANCVNTDFKTNDMGVESGEVIDQPDGSTLTLTHDIPNYIGMYVTNSSGSVMGAQTPNKGNRWFGRYTGASNNFAARNLNSPAQIQLFPIEVTPYGHASNQSPDTFTHVSPPSDWFVDTGIVVATCENFQQFQMESEEGGSSELRLDAFGEMVVEGSYAPTEYSAPSKWQAQRGVYATIDDAVKVNEDAIAYGSPEYAFYDSLKHTTVAEFKQVEDMKKLESSAIAALQNDAAALSGQKAALINYMLSHDRLLSAWQRDSSTASIAAVNAAIAAKRELMEQMAELQQELNEKEVQLIAARSEAAAAAKTENNGIGADAYYKQYKKDVNEIYLSSIAQNRVALSEGEYDKLREIAERCFMEVGEAVFEARALLSLHEVRDYSDHDICTEAGYAMKRDEAADTMPGRRTWGYNLHPNPAKDYIRLSVFGREFSNEAVELTDAMGRIWLRVNVSDKGKEMSIDVSMLPVGVYVCRVKQDEETIYTRKLNILR